MSETKGRPKAGEKSAAAISAARGARTGAALQAVTANRLSDGVVIYLAENGDWVRQPGAAAIAEGKEAAAALLARAEQDVTLCRVVAPYLIDMVRNPDGSLRPATYREHIRAGGPSVGNSLGKQTREG